MSVDPGHMVLYDRMQPALLADNYRVKARTDVQVETDQDGDGKGTIATGPLGSDTRYFDVVGPRFQLPPTELGGLYPPRNGHGDFSETLPHVAFYRRTLPWERDLDPKDVLPGPAPVDGGAPALSGIRPWIALLLFEEDEITVERGVALETVLPSTVRTAIEAPTGVVCDAVVVDRETLLDVLPSPDEMEVLTHVRQVNVNDRELAAGDSDGWFSVVMSNRLPEAGHYRACVVSLEGRTDLFDRLRNRPPPGPTVGTVVATAEMVADLERLVRTFPDRTDFAEALDRARTSLDTPAAPPEPAPASAPPDDHLVIQPERDTRLVGELVDWVTLARSRPTEKVVLLASWTFESVGTGTFSELCRELDVGMIGEHAPGVGVADSGHVAIELKNRAGAQQTAWYRGPLVPYPMTRDENGPYHSADQCRRVTPETGMEDVSYAAGFEVGRLLATSDGRLAQELMRWRRTAYRAARRALARKGLADGLTLADLADPDRPLAPLLGAHLTERILPGVPRIDRFEAGLLAGAPGLDPGELTRAWRLADVVDAEALLGGTHVDQIRTGPMVQPDVDQRAGHLRQMRGRVLDTLRRNGV